MGVDEFKYYRGVDREKTLDELRKVIEGVEGILFAYAHGSFLERGLFRDLDVALWIENSDEAFTYEVELSSKLEVTLEIPLDIQVLNEAPLPFRYSVFTKGRLLLSRDEGIRARVVDETLREYFDLILLRSLVLGNLKESYRTLGEPVLP